MFNPAEIKGQDGKVIKKSYQNALAKAQETPFWKELPAGEYPNLFTGQEFSLTSLQASVYAWVMRWQAQYERGVMPTPVSTFDNMRYLFLALDSRLYMELLD